MTDVKTAKTIEGLAKELAAAAGTYQRLSGKSARSNLAAGIELLLGRLNGEYAQLVTEQKLISVLIDYHTCEGEE
jgi:hypothetical protein